MPEIRGNFRSFPEAVAFFRQKINLPSERWDDLWQGEHARAFVVAGATRDALLSDLYEAIDATIHQGETLADFRKRFDDIIQRNGWVGFTGSGSERGLAWRAAVIYHTNIRTAYMAGRWEQLKTFPYLKYQHNTIKNPRETHKLWNGLIIDRTDPWWQTHYPPNGWGCRCTVTGVSKARLIAEGRKAPDKPPPLVPGDPPPEWAYNVGEAASGQPQADAPVAPEAPGAAPAESPTPDEVLTSGDWSTAGRPESVPVDPMVIEQTVREISRDVIEPVSIVRKAGEVRYAVQTDLPALERAIDIGEAVAKTPYVQAALDVLTDPFEIYAAFLRTTTGRIRLTTRLVKGVQLPDGSKVFVVANVERGQVRSIGFMDAEAINAQRVGELLWGRGDRAIVEVPSAPAPPGWGP